MSKRGRGALFWLCYDAHLDDLTIGGRAGARHSGDSLLCRHEMQTQAQTAVLGVRRCELAMAVRRLGRKPTWDGRAGRKRAWDGGESLELRRDAVYCSSCSTRSKE
jgi:hypothetical protein